MYVDSGLAVLNMMRGIHFLISFIPLVVVLIFFVKHLYSGILSRRTLKVGKWFGYFMVVNALILLWTDFDFYFSQTEVVLTGYLKGAWTKRIFQDLLFLLLTGILPVWFFRREYFWSYIPECSISDCDGYTS